MAQRKESWAPGTPAWVDISVTDLARSQAFYRSVLGWEFTEGGPEYGGYTNALVGGEVAAGMSPPMEGAPEAPHVWMTYLATNDSAGLQGAIESAGGQTIFPPMAVGPFGTMAIYTDPTGAAFGTWESGEHTGFNVYNENGAVAWNEAMVGDFDAAKQFYTAVFGYHYQDMSSGDQKYATFSLADEERPVGGIGLTEPGQPPYWAVTFAVDDTDAALARATAMGSTVLLEPFDFEYGRLAVVTGPDGEPFGLLAGMPG